MNHSMQEIQWLLTSRANPADPALRKMGLLVKRPHYNNYLYSPPPPTRQSNHRERRPEVDSWTSLQGDSVTAISLPSLARYSKIPFFVDYKASFFNEDGTTSGRDSLSNQLTSHGSNRVSQEKSVKTPDNLPYIYWTHSLHTQSNRNITNFHGVRNKRVEEVKQTKTSTALKTHAKPHLHRSVNLARMKFDYLQNLSSLSVPTSASSKCSWIGSEKSESVDACNMLLQGGISTKELLSAEPIERLKSPNIKSQRHIPKSANLINVFVPY